MASVALLCLAQDSEWPLIPANDSFAAREHYKQSQRVWGSVFIVLHRLLTWKFILKTRIQMRGTNFGAGDWFYLPLTLETDFFFGSFSVLARCQRKETRVFSRLLHWPMSAFRTGYLVISLPISQLDVKEAHFWFSSYHKGTLWNGNETQICCVLRNRLCIKLEFALKDNGKRCFVMWWKVAPPQKQT